MNALTRRVKELVYQQCSLELTNYQEEYEGREYDACRYELNGKKVLSRSARTTPKKAGQFVTFWERDADGPIRPFSESSSFDLLVVNVQTGDHYGQFVFSQSVLVAKGIVSTAGKEGKRAFRLYPSWDHPTSKQALASQEWQLNYFHKMDGQTDLALVKKLFEPIH